MITRFCGALMLLAALFVAAPDAKAEFRYGPTAGVDITDLRFKQNLFSVDKSVGFSGGIMAEMMFPGVGFGIDFGLLYQMRGAKMHMGEKPLWQWQGYDAPVSRLHTLSLPIHLRFKYERLGGLEDILKPFVFVGPDFGFLVGHNKIDALSYAGGDVAMDFGLGVELFNHLQISGSYGWGLTYTLKTKILTDFSARSDMWQVRVAWLF
ncbi:MAG: PorT family protein [Paramuribaculum sp.]|nr:PorT family protein [Paramuribaculum sp.]